MMVRVTKISVVEKPDVSDIEDLVLGVIEEFGEVFSWLNEVTEPNHSWKIGPSAWEESTTELNTLGVLLTSSLYTRKDEVSKDI
jgi:NTP pyrophosphatase (non-canonical NTP hydrolase)